MKKIIIIALSAVLALSLAACSAGGGKSVATVNGNNITEAQVATEFNRMFEMYGMTYDSLSDDSYFTPEDAQLYKNSVLDQLINSQLILEYAKQNNITLTDQEKQESAQSAKEYMTSMQSMFSSNAAGTGEDGATATPNPLEVKSQFDQYLKQMGYSESTLTKLIEDSTLMNKVYEAVVGNVQVTEADAKAKYDELVQTYTDQDQQDPAAAVDAYLNGEQEFEVYVPEKVNDSAKYVKHILIKIPDEAAQEIMTLQQEGTEEATAEADAKLQEALKGIQTKADEVLAKVQAGEDFDTLIAEYGEDPGMAEGSENAEKGYLVSPSAGFVPEFVDGSLALKKLGDTSGLVPSSYGYHILKYTGDLTPGALPFDDVKEMIIEALQAEQESEAWFVKLDEWRNSSKIAYVDAAYTPTEAPAEDATADDTADLELDVAPEDEADLEVVAE